MALARAFWQRFETLHAVTYFSDESIQAAKAVGLRGFWMGYFGFRAAPLGAVNPGPVEAVFANFAPSMVQRSLPDAWSFAAPERLVDIRAAAAANALRRLAPRIETIAVETNARLGTIVSDCSSIGRPLFAANRQVAPIADPVAQLWQHCTSLREHRGDGHVIALAAHGIDGCEAHRLLIAETNAPVEVLRDNRGWTETEWDAGTHRLLARQLIDESGLTDSGRQLRTDIETMTDELAYAPITAVMSEHEAERLVADLSQDAIAVARSGVVPYPNPIGLPKLD